jgi:hypothetical protein
MKQGLIGKTAAMTGDDQLAIAVLDFFIVGNCIVVKSEKRQMTRGRDQRRRSKQLIRARRDANDAVIRFIIT